MEFSLVDCNDVLVSKERRIHPERRKSDVTLEQIERVVSQLPRK